MNYAFPELPLENILGDLDQFFSLNLNETDFNKPDPLKWQDYYQHLLPMMVDSVLDPYAQQPLHMAEMDYPELHKDSLPLSHIVFCMRRVLKPCGILDFTVKDLIEPKFHRLVKVMSAVVNFQKFKCSMEENFRTIKGSIEQQRECYDMQIKKNDELKKKINRIKAERAKQEPVVAQIQGEIEDLNRDMDEHNRHRNAIQKTIEECKTRTLQQTAATDQLKESTSKVQGDIQRLSQKIVQSPERVRDEQDSMANQVRSLNEAFEGKRSCLGEAHQKRERTSQTIADTEKRLQLLLTVQASVNKEKDIDAEMGAINDQVQEKMEKINEMKNKRERLELLLTSRQEKLVKTSVQNQTRRNLMLEERDKLNAEHEELLSKQSTDVAKKNELFEYRKLKEEELRLEQQRLDKMVNSTKNIYGDVLQKLEEFNANLNERLG